MSQGDADRWDRQYAASRPAQQPASFLVKLFSAGRWPIEPGPALDLACGAGRNALFLAERGFDVHGVDISAVALAEAERQARSRSLSLRLEKADLESARLPRDRYRLIIDFNYLERAVVPQLETAPQPGGHLIFETYLIDQREIGEPKNPAYLLAHNELLHWFSACRVLYYREGKFLEDGAASYRARLLAQKRL